MTRHAWFWLALLTLTGFALYELGSVLVPFVAGAAVAYLLDPLVDALQRRRLSRPLATVVVTGTFCLAVVLLLLLLAPVLIGQVAGFARRLPDYMNALRDRALPLIDMAREMLPPDLAERLRAGAMDYAGPAASWLVGIVGGLLGGGVIIVNLVSIAVITPIVAFYLLLDWPRLVARLDSWLPRQHADTIREQVRLVDRTLAGFLRGQATVCFVLACFYGLGLSLVGLDFGLAIGVLTGLISFVPYFGMAIGLIIGVSLALVQFGSLKGVLMVVAVFAVGQFAEGNFLTPRFVGNRVGLHPVWIIFALLAGGALFGFVGILLAVPAAAVIGVGVRFALARYLASPFYLGQQPTDGGP
ncbi:MAG: AI-2E family transporter [Alphaproteobacteria bacterium]|nr:AI-2E family transporter [Alphaproteobacteria bacterium]